MSPQNRESSCSCPRRGKGPSAPRSGALRQEPPPGTAFPRVPESCPVTQMLPNSCLALEGHSGSRGP